ncbi:MAG: hypothetical protein A2848_00345 [Candidatus Magasanikbacteria bacterium RIFCSPHIGHO2_01_FULL_50_8]|uniref:Transcription regulator TrmB N-terminal domain-containing protein n=1 Tax=Candidatus Magasanikbacteria bacterium RIFCSPHIGHO2_01_FULL_50_8 TaxID=1798674 RepID=A0A1F6LRG7_9BACT|nr:MAG: hypothetical protein A2848_00345 [Candidatus Magasanikbacteria bacterium RIFCSPHIGHO2_01_FULL_50_8]
MDINSHLKEFGLKSTEIKIYLYLLENGVSSPAQIAKGTGVLRTNAYHVLRELLEAGLIEEQAGRGDRKTYIASDPSALLRALESRRETIARILPDLRSLYTTEKNKPRIKFYSGLKQIQEIYLSALDAKELFTLGSPETLYALMPEFMESWTAEMRRREIIEYDITSHASQKSVQKMSREIGPHYLAASLPPTQGPDLTTDLLLWDNNLALITLAEPFFGTVITDPHTARTFRMVLKILHSKLH